MQPEFIFGVEKYEGEDSFNYDKYDKFLGLVAIATRRFFAV